MKNELESHLASLSGTGAAQKIRELAKSARFCLFGTRLKHPPVTVRPMTVQEVDDAGDLWFLSGRATHTNQHIAADPMVQLFFVNGGSMEFLTTEGTATIHVDRATKEKYWTPIAKTWFNQGLEDPDLSVIQVRPQGGYYWDTKHGKVVSFLKVAAGAVTGRTLDDSIEGHVNP